MLSALQLKRSLSAVFCALVLTPGFIYGDSEKGWDRLYFLYPISSPYYPVVLTGDFLKTLIDVPPDAVSFYAVRASGLEPIPFQIDRRDAVGRYQIPVTAEEKAEEGSEGFDLNDECVFMAGDLGKKADGLAEAFQGGRVTEIEVADPRTDQRGWVYAVVGDGNRVQRSPVDYVGYSAAGETVESSVYRASFSRETTFLINRLQWKDSGTFKGSPDMTDTMKAKHQGKLFHSLPFERTQSDSETRLLAVKDGPVRVIRSSASRVRLLLNMRTPELYIDNIHYRNVFFMDTHIKIPFRIRLFFSNLSTIMTMDGNDDPRLPPAKVYSTSRGRAALIDGQMSPQEEAINASKDQSLIIDTLYGKILVALEHERGMPIDYHVYVMDDRNAADPPEDIPGQFGNVGFLTTGWEKLEPSLYHMVFSVYMVRGISVEKGFALLREAPRFAR